MLARLNRHIRRQAEKQARARWDAGERRMIGTVPSARKISVVTGLCALAGLLQGVSNGVNLGFMCGQQECVARDRAFVVLVTLLFTGLWGFLGYFTYKTRQLLLLEFQTLGGAIGPRDPVEILENAQTATLLGLVGAAGTFLVTLVGAAHRMAMVSGSAAVVLTGVLLLVVRAKRRRTHG